jgi:Major intrinsic protein
VHGHSFDTALLRVAVAEATGTFILVLTIVCTAIAATLAQPIAGVAYGSLSVPIAGGVALAVLVASLGPISGAHFNPAVTIGLAVLRKLPWSRVPTYVISHFAGAIGAALTAWWIYGPSARSVAHLGATAPLPGVGAWRAFGVDALVTDQRPDQRRGRRSRTRDRTDDRSRQIHRLVGLRDGTPRRRGDRGHCRKPHPPFEGRREERERVTEIEPA